MTEIAYQHQKGFGEEHSKSVRFAEFAELYEIECDEFPSDTWYNSREFAHFGINRKCDIRIFREAHGKTDTIDLAVHCLRGLEHHLSRYSENQVARRRNRLWDTLEIEQYNQDQAGTFDAYRLAYVASQCTYVCRAAARDRAIQDELDVIHMDEKKEEITLDNTETPHKKKQQPAKAEKDIGVAFVNTWQKLLGQINTAMKPPQRRP